MALNDYYRSDLPLRGTERSLTGDGIDLCDGHGWDESILESCYLFGMTNVTRVNFQQRLARGEEFEQRVIKELESRGWEAHRYGAGTWSEGMKDILRQSDSDLRWAPDLYATRGRSELVFIDCKNTMSIRDGDHHTINRRCLDAGRKFGPRYDWPLYYVFDGLGVMTPHQVMDWQKMRRLGHTGAYVRLPRHMPVPFDEVFGAPGQMPALRAA